MPLKAIIFDMDGVLTATVDFHYRSWKQVTEEFGIPFTQKDNEKLRGLTRYRSLETILKGKVLPEERMQEILKRKNQYFLQMIEDMNISDLLPGVKELLPELHQAGIKVGVASASRNTQVVLNRLEILPFIDKICDGNTVKRSKPAPDVYLHTLKALRVKADDTLAIEDGVAGVEAALSAGIGVIGLGSLEQMSRATAVFPDLSGIHLDDLLVVYHWRQAARLYQDGLQAIP